MRWSHLALLAAAGLLLSGAAHASPKGWDDASDIGRDALVAAALTVPAIQGDWSGDLQAVGSIGLAWGAAEGLKHAVHEERPDHSDRHSFPSAHASQAFAAAATLDNRYGWQAGLPAFAVASFVAAARVEARKHHWYDCLAGAAIGTTSGFLLTKKRNDRVRLLPWGDASGGGISLAMRF
jgi:membrane-associated phospholipid phosphatase